MLSTVTTASREKLSDAARDVREAGGTPTQIFATIARILAGPAGTDEEFTTHLDDIGQTASFFWDDLCHQVEDKTGTRPYSPDATFDELTGDMLDDVLNWVVIYHAEEAEPPAPPIVLADSLLNGLRKAAALKVEYGDHYGPVRAQLHEVLVTLLGTQSVDRDLAVAAIDHALVTGKFIAEAVAHADGQL
ncbi:hypothetical protein GCM10023194_81250 [Planotetraspora phitsanulokensis]|uniref:Uncharacterized protein n=1 Tax=Planotetraspora phitsanulokensis TaxID=575192 RepID=A0A8J3XI88_9ACTN|nr:hypothetical protein [Planotetraspora phitsanulokensis]GII42892.1 hypothetical protein Pph01_78950 [Planotetraspora phitsanulokensis]